MHKSSVVPLVFLRFLCTLFLIRVQNAEPLILLGSRGVKKRFYEVCFRNFCFRSRLMRLDGMHKYTLLCILMLTKFLNLRLRYSVRHFYLFDNGVRTMGNPIRELLLRFTIDFLKIPPVLPCIVPMCCDRLNFCYFKHSYTSYSLRSSVVLMYNFLTLCWRRSRGGTYVILWAAN